MGERMKEITRNFLIAIGGGIFAIVIILLLRPVIRDPQPDWWKEQMDECNLRANENLLNEYNWVCVEWANTTIPNPAWLDNCCSEIGVNLTDQNSEYHMTGSIAEVETGFRLSKVKNDTYYTAGLLCFDVNGATGWDFSNITIGDKTIDLSICESIPQMIETNESICVLQRRREW